MQNTHKIGARIKTIKEFLITDTNRDKEFYLNHVFTFVMKVISPIEECRKKKSLPSSPRVKEIQAGWKGRIDILKSLKEKCALLEDRKSDMFFKTYDAIATLGGPSLI